MMILPLTLCAKLIIMITSRTEDTMATSKQIGYIAALAAQKGYKSAREAAVAYGFDAAVSFDYMSVPDASGLIEWLKAPAKSEEQIAAELEAARVRADEKAKAIAEYKAQTAAIQAENEARRIRVDAILAERGLSHLSGQPRKDARAEIIRALKAGEIA
jgi:hypothetical protein